MKLTVGQTVCVKCIGYNRRGKNDLEDAVITKVGKKYFELYGWVGVRFFIDTLIQDGKGYSPSFRVYLTKQEILDEQEKSELYNAIKRQFFDTFSNKQKISLQQLRDVVKLLNIDNNQNTENAKI
jgi:hypothetical protein